MELPVVAGVDGSYAGLWAVDWAADEAERHGLPLRLVYASLWERYESGTSFGEPAQRTERALEEHIVGAALERAEQRSPGLKVVVEVLPEDPVSALLHAGRSAFALVIGSRGRGERAGALLGSVSLAVAARADCPMIVVRGGAQRPNGRGRRIAVGVGDAGHSAAAVRFAFREAAARGCVLEAVRAWRCPAREMLPHPMWRPDAVDSHEEQARSVLDAALRRPAAEYPRVEVRRLSVEGPAHHALLEESVAADLLVVGAHRLPGRAGPVLGRTNHALLHHAPCPVAVIPRRRLLPEGLP